MIFLRITSRDEQKIEEIAKFLLEDRLAIDLNIKRNVERIIYEQGKLKTIYVSLITAKTKGLLFPHIDKLLREKYPNNMPEIYSLPIVHMDWEQSKQLTDDIIQV